MNELVLIFTLLGAVAALATLAECLGVPYPSLLVLGGLGLAFVPRLPSRLEGRAVWDVVVFLLNGLAFILIGLQLPEIVGVLGGYSAAELARSGVPISLTVVLTRLV